MIPFSVRISVIRLLAHIVLAGLQMRLSERLVNKLLIWLALIRKGLSGPLVRLSQIIWQLKVLQILR